MRWAVWGVIAVAAGLRLFWIHAASLDIDEGFALWVAQHPLHGIWDLVARLDNHPPLYYYVLHLWIRLFGDGEAAVRLLSAVCGVVTIPFAYAVGRIVGGWRLGLLTAFFMAVSPDYVEWSQEARMYALEILALAAAVTAFAWLLAHPDAAAPPAPDHSPIERRRRLAWTAYVAGTAAALWAEYTAVLFPFAASVALGAVCAVRLWAGAPSRGGAGRRLLLNWLGANLAVGVLCIPLVILLMRRLHGGPLMHFYQVNPNALPTTVLAAIGLIALGRAIWKAEPHWTAFTVALWAIPIIAIYVLSLRYLIFAKQTYAWTALPLFLAVGAGLLRVPGRALRTAALAAVVAFNLSGLITHYRDDVRWNALRGWDRAAAYVGPRVESGDVILFFVPYVQPAFDYYVRRYHREVEEHGVPADFGTGNTLFPPITEGDLPRLRALLTGHHRAWLIHGMFPSARMILETLNRGGTLLSRRTVTGALEIYLYQMR